MKVLRKIIEVDEEKCDGCGQCVPACEEGAIQIIDGKAKLVAEKYCDGLGACLGECPNDAIRLIEREAEDFDEEAVEEYLSSKNKDKQDEKLACGCPSNQVQILSKGDKQQNRGEKVKSALSHWPVQIKLVPPHAPFLQNADLLVVADCVAVAYPNLHADMLPGRVIMIGCPKFDDRDEYVEKFTQIFSNNNINSVEVLIMTVPCCSALPSIVKKGIEKSGKSITIKQTVINPEGNIVDTLIK
ncbi:4Fe-4S dicluster domain-containing protein [Desulfothermus okinawensis JCM 13304]